VAEKCITTSSPVERESLILSIVGAANDDGKTLFSVVKDPYGNYVVQKLVDVVDAAQRKIIFAKIKRHLPALRKITYGKHIIAKVEKMTGRSLADTSSAKPTAIVTHELDDIDLNNLDSDPRPRNPVEEETKTKKRSS
jgi:hypothetical protein